MSSRAPVSSLPRYIGSTVRLFGEAHWQNDKFSFAFKSSSLEGLANENVPSR